MASRLLKTAPLFSSGSGDSLKVSKLGNGLLVASLNASIPVVSLALVSQFGSRNESYESQGVSHAYRTMSGFGGGKHSSLAVVRSLQQTGGFLNVYQDREFTYSVLSCLQNQLDSHVADVFLDSVCSPSLKSWEVNDWLSKHLFYDIQKVSHMDQTMELLHNVAFRSQGLGYSLYCPENLIHSHGSLSIQSFLNQNYFSSSSALIGIGIDHDTTCKYAEKVILKEKKTKGEGGHSSSSLVVFDGEVRLEKNTPLSYVAIAVQTNPSNLIINMILSRILGAQPGIKWCGGMGQFHKKLPNSLHYNSSFNISYSDTSLLGTLFVSDNKEQSELGKCVQSVVSSFKSLKVSKAEVEAAKKYVIGDLVDYSSKSHNVLKDLGKQVLLNGDNIRLLTPSDIQNITHALVQEKASQLSSSKLVMASLGNLKNVPYIQDC